MRLGVFADLVYRRDEDGISTDTAFVLFVLGLREYVDELVIFGRLDPSPGRAAHPVDGPNVRFVPLPHYPNLRHLVAVARSSRRVVEAVRPHLDRLDAVWLFGPHPLALGIARAARQAGVAVALGVRQDMLRYTWGRLPSKVWAPVMGPVVALDIAFRALGRRVPTVVIGHDLAARYRGGQAPVLVATISLVRAADVSTADEALGRDWSETIDILSVGRLDPEKNPLLLAEVLADLRAGSDRHWEMRVAGTGPLASALAGTTPAPSLLGEVVHGPALWNLYRESHVLLHVSLTEGVPQVLLEAMAAGLPIVATDVGGVRAALGDGERGLLVAPRDAAAAAAAVRRVVEESQLRERLVRAGLLYASEHTMERELARVAEFLGAAAAT